MKLPLSALRWLNRRNISRGKLKGRLRGTWLHRWVGDKLFAKELWALTPESTARAWLIGFPITMVPLMPLQTVFASVAGLFIRANLPLCIALQFLSTPLTAPIQLPACYLVGALIRGRTPALVWSQVSHASTLFSGDGLISMYLGAVVIGVIGGAIGYAAIPRLWPKKRPRTPLASSAPSDDSCNASGLR